MTAQRAVAARQSPSKLTLRRYRGRTTGAIAVAAMASSLATIMMLALASNAGAQTPQARRAAPPDTIGEFANFSQWQGVSTFIDELVARDGFQRKDLEAVLRQTQYVDSAVRLMRPAPPGRPKNWQAYRARFVEPIRINAGTAFWNQHASALGRAEAQYGVPAEIIVGIIGVETVYGRNTGSFRVMDAITTLAFAYPDTPNRDARMAYFRGELENTLLFARESGLDPFSLLGSYAGAIGLPQFMPGSIRQYAIDFDGDGKIDLRNSPVDAIGSVANFLVKHGWKSGEPIVFAATVGAAPLPLPGATSTSTSTLTPTLSVPMRAEPPTPAAADSAAVNPTLTQAPGMQPLPDTTDANVVTYAVTTPVSQIASSDILAVPAATSNWRDFLNQGLEAKFTMNELRAAGVMPDPNAPADQRFGLVDLQNGLDPTQYWIGGNNFFAITQYNRSFFYAMSVVELGRAIRTARGAQ